MRCLRRHRCHRRHALGKTAAEILNVTLAPGAHLVHGDNVIFKQLAGEWRSNPQPMRATTFRTRTCWSADAESPCGANLVALDDSDTSRTHKLSHGNVPRRLGAPDGDSVVSHLSSERSKAPGLIPHGRKRCLGVRRCCLCAFSSLLRASRSCALRCRLRTAADGHGSTWDPNACSSARSLALQSRRQTAPFASAHLGAPGACRRLPPDVHLFPPNSNGQ